MVVSPNLTHLAPLGFLRMGRVIGGLEGEGGGQGFVVVVGLDLVAGLDFFVVSGFDRSFTLAVELCFAGASAFLGGSVLTGDCPLGGSIFAAGAACAVELGLGDSSASLGVIASSAGVGFVEGVVVAGAGRAGLAGDSSSGASRLARLSDLVGDSALVLKSGKV
jgi:hypothetical protein